ncbi:MAG TPA: hypothetical protein PLK04_10425 [Bacillota bacterium]|nr:hypothetical protein [Bacillota bacterium]
MNQTRKPITAEEFLGKATQIIDIHGWEPGETIPVKVRRVSMTSLIASGQVPNTLLKHAYSDADEFVAVARDDTDTTAQAVAMIDAVARAVLLEPSWDEVGEFLTDEQKIDLFNYAQGGLVALESFRPGQGTGAETGGSGEGVQPATE